MSDITKDEVLDGIGGLVDALTAYADRIDKEVELIVRTDGTASLMVEDGTQPAGEAASGFGEVEAFDSFSDLWVFLQMGSDL